MDNVWSLYINNTRIFQFDSKEEALECLEPYYTTENACGSSNDVHKYFWISSIEQLKLLELLDEDILVNSYQKIYLILQKE